MNRILTMFLFAAVFGFTTTAVAHEGSEHKGKPVEGEVTAVAVDRLTLKTATTTLTVVLDDKTRFERGDQPASKADVKQGDHLTAFGTRLATGELVAGEIHIGGAHEDGTSGHPGHEIPGGQPH